MNFPENFPAPDEYLLELGRITALWGALESSVNNAINYLSGINREDHWRVSVLTAHSNFKQRVDIIKTLCNELQEMFPNLKMYQETAKLIEQAQKQRNHYLHNGLFYNDSINKVQTTKIEARGVLKTQVRNVSLSELKEVSAKIHVALLSLHQLITQKKYDPVWEREKC
ncbi:hypothetical protein [Microbulbifer sp. HZ11]|uniref:hypothetical protein n=1 Tax=Microbulbifer sp. HZ11 TaxID=1453501 RepID=UPI0005B7D2AE|nr:hypothetical protein [Microbulbifer sp. HZ11]